MGDEIIKVLDALCDKFGIVIDWSSQNVMPYLTDLADRVVKYEVYSSLTKVILWLLLTYITVRFTIIACKKEDELYERDLEWLSSVGVTLSGIFIFVAVIIVVCQLSDVVTALTIPEKILIYELQSLL